jgi:hypothetical protein
MQLDLDVCGFDPRKLQTGCDGLRVRIFAKIHSVRNAEGYVSYGGIGERSTVGYGPRLENLVRRLIGIVFGQILSGILLSEGPFETLERIRVDEIVGVVRFAGWIVWQGVTGGGGWGCGGGLHGGEIC